MANRRTLRANALLMLTHRVSCYGSEAEYREAQAKRLQREPMSEEQIAWMVEEGEYLSHVDACAAIRRQWRPDWR